MKSVNIQPSNKLKLASSLIVIMFITGSITSLWLTDRMDKDSHPGFGVNSEKSLPVPPKPELQIYKPMLPDQAKAQNDKLPFSGAPLERALPLVLPSDDTLLGERKNAADCLTSAIYYEAGNELSQGKRAVAQVILNRVRHPAYPKSICGVVYQGSGRKTGCQFTFTCDGSLSRRPARDRWEQARIIAISAIAGGVEPSVGMATHYHANYVMPYWAASLDKVSQIGTHIFYRWKGSWGRRRAFSQLVQLDSENHAITSIAEPLPVAQGKFTVEPPTTARMVSRIIADDVSSASILLLSTREIGVTLPVASMIKADQSRSQLAIDTNISAKN